MYRFTSGPSFLKAQFLFWKHNRENIVVQRSSSESAKIDSATSLCLTSPFVKQIAITKHDVLNPHLTNGLSHPYQLDESTFIFRGIRSIFSFLFHFSMNIISANRIASDETPLYVASRRVLRRHIWGYSVCLCPVKRTPDFYGLRANRSRITKRHALAVGD